MDWPRDNACLSQKKADLERLFKYKPRPSIVIQTLQSNEYRMQIWSLETNDEWAQWLHFNTNVSHSDRGFTIILAKRAGELSGCEPSNDAMSYSEWLERLDASSTPKSTIRRASTFAPLGDKQPMESPTRVHEMPAPQTQQSISTLPFSIQTFKKICEQFNIHESIVRSVTRSDIPSFSCNSIRMGQPAYVYHCRTSNSWDLDLALTATYYPKRGVTYAMIFGCPQSVEKLIVDRLHTVTYEAAHPLLLPGVFTELELIRHKRLVESSINDVEAKIFELDFQANVVQYLSKNEIERRNEAKRSSWLDLTYLRNSLITWNTQTLKMTKHAEELNAGLFDPNKVPETRPDQTVMEHDEEDSLYLETHEMITSTSMADTYIDGERYLNAKDLKQMQKHDVIQPAVEAVHRAQMESVGDKIKMRLDAIRDEYDEKIRDCTMRVDGMAMATQWAQGETAVEIALATSRDSKVMRSISLVTMVFLPGTFLATVFSMTFFNWFDGDGNGQISSSLWIYVVVTVLFTSVTLGLWYYFVIHRRTNRKMDEEKMIVV
ncbi:Nn.00g032070.m01.CDS01 [Neocucurbitaria sp. VM-36]